MKTHTKIRADPKIRVFCSAFLIPPHCIGAIKEIKIAAYNTAVARRLRIIAPALASGISNDKIDEYYERALDAGAVGGKILGAGGGGFLLIYCPQSKQSRVREALSDLPNLEFAFESEGSKIIYVI